MQPTAICSTPNCDQAARARGLCSPCYGRAYRAGKIQPELRIGIHSLSQVNVTDKTAVCTICGPTSIRIRGGRRGPECRVMRNKYRGPNKGKRSPEGRRRDWLRAKYGITPDQYDAMVEATGGRCAICNVEARLVVDHCHTTGAVRGVLCQRCNFGLGWFDDDIDRMRVAAEYVKSRGFGTPAA